MTTHRLPGAGEMAFLIFALVGAVVVITIVVSVGVSGLAWVAAQVTGVDSGMAAGYIITASLGAAAGWVARAVYDVPNGDSNV